MSIPVPSRFFWRAKADSWSIKLVWRLCDPSKPIQQPSRMGRGHPSELVEHSLAAESAGPWNFQLKALR
jgi:hypothetical protein